MADDKDLDLDVTEEEKPKSKLVLIVIVLVVVLAGGGAAAFFLMSGGGGDDEDFEEGEVAEVKKVAIYVPMKPAFVINFMVGGRTRYAQIDVTLMTRDGYVVDALQMHMPLIRNNLVTSFSAQDFEDIQTVEGREVMREGALEEIQTILMEELGEPGLEQVLFTHFVIQ